MSLALRTHANHYAAVRARLWAPRVVLVVVPDPEPSQIQEAPIDVRPFWSTPYITEIGDERTRLMAAIDALRQRPLVNAHIIARVVAHAFDITTSDIFGDSRRALFVRPRQLAMALAHRELRGRVNGTLPAIGRVFGGRDHTTVLHAVRKFGSLVDEVARAAPIAD